MEKNYTYKVTHSDDGYTIINAKITAEKFIQVKEKVYTKLAPEVKVTGFRPGKAPKAVIEARLGGDLYEQSLNELLPEIALDIVQQEKLEPMTRLNYEVQKVSDAEGVEFVAKFIAFPEFTLADAKNLKIKKADVKIDSETLVKEEARILEIYNKRKQGNKKEEAEKVNKEEAKELTDEVVKNLGIGLNTVEELRDNLRKQLEFEQMQKVEETYMRDILNAMIEKSKIAPAEALIKEELARREVEYKEQIEKLGLKLEEFLQTQKTTLPELQEKWRSEIKTRLAQEILLYEIIKQQKLEVSAAEIEHEVNAIQDEKLRSEYQTPEGKRYVGTIIMQQKALQHLKSEVEAAAKK